MLAVFCTRPFTRVVVEARSHAPAKLRFRKAVAVLRGAAQNRRRSRERILFVVEQSIGVHFVQRGAEI